MYTYRPVDGSPGCIPGQTCKTSYQAMSALELNTRSQFPPGYGGFQNEVKFKFGYGNLGSTYALTQTRPTSRDWGVRYDTRPSEMKPLPRTQSSPTIEPKKQQLSTPHIPSGPVSPLSGKARTMSNFFKAQPTETPGYFDKQESTPFPYYRPMSGKNGLVSPGGQYPAHPGPPFVCPKRDSDYQHHPQHMEASWRAPLTTQSSSWGTCSAGYRRNAASLGRVDWMPAQHTPANFTTTYRTDIDAISSAAC